LRNLGEEGGKEKLLPHYSQARLLGCCCPLVVAQSNRIVVLTGTSSCLSQHAVGFSSRQRRVL
jgi:hypothetical protein